MKLTRRAILAAAAGAGVGAGLDRALDAGSDTGAGAGAQSRVVPFHGAHQAGIATPVQGYLHFAAFDVLEPSPSEVRRLLERWTEAAAVLTAGHGYQPVTPGPAAIPSDPGEADGLPPARLTLTFGFGPSIFDKSSGPLSLARRPAALHPLPPFAGEQLDLGRSGGDLCVQACADDPQVAFHAVHVLTLLARPTAELRWAQPGFRRPMAPDSNLHRNLIGFQDGTSNLRVDDAEAMRRFVWVQPGDEPTWMAGGTYLVLRRIEIQFPSWDALSLGVQEQTIGRHKLSGARLDAIAPHAHIRQAAPANNAGMRILRRGFNFSSGTDLRGQLQGGLFFIAFARDPLKQFVPIQRRLASQDALSAFTLHTAGAIFACPPGTRPDGSIGEGLLS